MIDGYWLQAMIYPKGFDRTAAVEDSRLLPLVQNPIPFVPNVD